MKLRKAYVLKEDFNFFGKIISKGTVYRTYKDKDYYIPNVYDKGTMFTCPNMRLHFKVVKNNDKYFIEIYYPYE